MTIIEPNVESIEQGENIVSHVARCARVCYKRETGNDEKLVENLYKNHHWSMFRHETHYCVIPTDEEIAIWLSSLHQAGKVMNQKLVGIDIDLLANYYSKSFIVVFNGNWKLDNINFANQLSNYEVSADEFANYSERAREMMRYTFKITTQISTSRELNRVSPNNIAEQSTRYVYEDGTICRPHWLDNTYFIGETFNGVIEVWKNEDEDVDIKNKILVYARACRDSFNNYKYLINTGVPRQDARGVLPLDTATEVVYTYSWSEWKHIIELRADKRAHPNAQIIANMIKEQLNILGYDI